MIENTLFIGFNPGFGCGYDLLLQSWCKDLVILFNLGYKVVFTQANDYSDLRGETRVFQTVFKDKVNYFLPAMENPFRAVTHYVQDGRKEGSWSCASTHMYGLQGWKSDESEGKVTMKQVKEYIGGKEGKALLKECAQYWKKGAPL